MCIWFHRRVLKWCRVLGVAWEVLSCECLLLWGNPAEPIALPHPSTSFSLSFGLLKGLQRALLHPDITRKVQLILSFSGNYASKKPGLLFSLSSRCFWRTIMMRLNCRLVTTMGRHRDERICHSFTSVSATSPRRIWDPAEDLGAPAKRRCTATHLLGPPARTSAGMEPFRSHWNSARD